MARDANRGEQRAFNGRHPGRWNNGRQDPPSHYSYDTSGVPLYDLSAVPVERVSQGDIFGEGPAEMKTEREPQRSTGINSETEAAQPDEVDDIRTVRRGSQPPIWGESRDSGPPKESVSRLGQCISIGLAALLVCYYLIIVMHLELKLVLTSVAVAVTIKIWAARKSRRKASIGPGRAPHRAANGGGA